MSLRVCITGDGTRTFGHPSFRFPCPPVTVFRKVPKDGEEGSGTTQKGGSLREGTLPFRTNDTVERPPPKGWSLGWVGLGSFVSEWSRRH